MHKNLGYANALELIMSSIALHSRLNRLTVKGQSGQHVRIMPWHIMSDTHGFV